MSKEYDYSKKALFEHKRALSEAERIEKIYGYFPNVADIKEKHRNIRENCLYKKAVQTFSATNIDDRTQYLMELNQMCRDHNIVLSQEDLRDMYKRWKNECKASKAA